MFPSHRRPQQRRPRVSRLVGLSILHDDEDEWLDLSLASQTGFVTFRVLTLGLGGLGFGDGSPCKHQKHTFFSVYLKVTISLLGYPLLTYYVHLCTVYPFVEHVEPKIGDSSCKYWGVHPGFLWVETDACHWWGEPPRYGDSYLRCVISCIIISGNIGHSWRLEP